MANKDVFNTRDASVPVADHENRAGGRAYRLEAKDALAKAAVTGCFSDTFYADAKTQVADVLKLADQCEPEFVAKVAVFSRERGFMKDMPAFLAAWLHCKGEADLLKKVFAKVIDNGRMVRNFVQMVRSGALGRKSFGHGTKKLLQEWLLGRHPAQLLNDSVGKDPSLADILKMVHPKAPDAERVALHGYLLGKEHDAEALPENVKAYEAWKKDPEAHEVPRVPFQMLTFRSDLPKSVWASIARNARWMMTRMNLNTFDRHGVFEDQKMVDLVAERLADPKEVRSARAFPYQLLTAYHQTAGVPVKVREALQDAMEVAVENVPGLGRVAVLVDTSGSMGQPITGWRPGAASATKCVDVAALIASAILRTNKEATVVPFDTRVHPVDLNPRDSVMTNAAKLARYGGGGTACSSAMRYLNSEGKPYDLVVMVSDNESWADYAGRGYFSSRGTGFATEWTTFKKKNPEAKLALIDLTPNRSAQMKVGGDVLLVGGFSDMVFDVLDGFMQSTESDWIATVEKTKL